MESDVILSIRNLVKRYPGVLALDHVSLDFKRGEVHALLGENGAGKSTLVKVITGAIEPDSGTVSINGQQYTRMDPYLARSLGIEVIHQEFNLIPPLSVAENIFLGDRIGGRWRVDFKAMRERTLEVFRQLNIAIDPDQLVRDLSPAQQRLVEIAKSVHKDARVLVMDEPTAPLSVAEAEHLFEIISQLRRRGVTTIYISHRLEEVFRIADRVSVMRDGRYIATKNIAETNRKELISLMVGRELTESYPVKASAPSEVALEIKQLSGNGVRDISFSVRKGEILGLAGLVGAGRTELAMLIFGAARAENGEVWVDGKRVAIHSPADAIRHGIGLLPEDRKGQGLFLEMSVKWNACFPIIRKISRHGLVDTRKEAAIAAHYRERLDIRTPNLEQRVKNLSGGNQQKVVLAKSLAAESDILIFDEPTKGIDVGTKQEIYRLMRELAGNGIAIIMISSDMQELLGMSDRIVVLCEGRLAGEVRKDQFSQNYILDLASGPH